MFQQCKAITSVQNGDYKRLNRLMTHSRERRKQRVMILEGIHLTQACLNEAIEIDAVYVNERSVEHEEIKRIVSSLDHSIPLSVMPEALMCKITHLVTAPEIMVICARPAPAYPSHVSSRVILDAVQDPGNLGTILRATAAAGIADVFLGKGCVDAYSPKVLRAAMGAHFLLSIYEEVDLLALLTSYPGKRLLTSLGAKHSLYCEDLTGNVAFVFGNEGAGVSSELSAVADVSVAIPMLGRTESLNVAMAATVCLFERVRQNEAKKKTSAYGSPFR